MKKVDNTHFLLSDKELAKLTAAAIKEVERAFELPEFNPNKDKLVHIVNRAHKLLYGTEAILWIDNREENFQ